MSFLFSPPSFLSLLLGKIKKIPLIWFLYPIWSLFFYCYLFCFWCLLKFIFLFNFVPKHFISFNFCIQFYPHLIVIIFIPLLIYLCFSIFSLNILFYLIFVLIIIFAIFYIIFLIYLCFSIMSLNILFDLIFVFKFASYSFNCYLFLSISWFICFNFFVVMNFSSLFYPYISDRGLVKLIRGESNFFFQCFFFWNWFFFQFYYLMLGYWVFDFVIFSSFLSVGLSWVTS